MKHHCKNLTDELIYFPRFFEETQSMEWERFLMSLVYESIQHEGKEARGEACVEAEEHHRFDDMLSFLILLC